MNQGKEPAPLKIAVLISGRGSNMQALANHVETPNASYQIVPCCCKQTSRWAGYRGPCRDRDLLIDRKIMSKQNHERALATAIEASEQTGFALLAICRCSQPTLSPALREK